MALFADNMKKLTGKTEACARRRSSALAAVSERTEQVLAEARAFPRQVRSQQRQNARALRKALATGRKELAREIGEQRRETLETHHEVGRELQDALTRARVLRREAVRVLLTCYRTARKELGQDLREAARCWREAGR